MTGFGLPAGTMLAVRELRRARVRFGLLVAALGLLVFLILFQASLQNGLLTSFVGAIRNQSAPVLVYSVDGQRVIQASVITPELDAAVRSVEGIGDTGWIGQGTFTVAAGGQRHDASIVGVDNPALGYPRSLSAGRLPSGLGEAVASDADGDLGFALGDTVVVEPGGLVLTIVGVGRDIQLNAGPTLFTDFSTYSEAVLSNNPDGMAPLPNLVAIAPGPGMDEADLIRRINEASPDLDALGRSQAADLTPGVAQVRQSFRVIFLLYGLVIPCVTGLFFLIITFQKAAALTLLRAVGAPAGRLVGALATQTITILGAAFVVGLALYTPLSQQRLGSIPLRFETGAVVVWLVLLFTLGLLSSLLAARRVLAIDPIAATTGRGDL